MQSSSPASPPASEPRVDTGALRRFRALATSRSARLWPKCARTAIGSTAWMSYMAPAGTPPDIVARMNREPVAALKEPDTRQKLEAAFMDPVGNTPAELATFMEDELARWTPAIRRSGAMEQ